MVSDFSNDWLYWLPLAAMVTLCCWLLRAKLLDFQFLIVLLLCQFALHSLITFGAGHSIFWFCAIFLVLFMATAYSRRPPRFPQIVSTVDRRIAERWSALAQWYLLIYFAIRLAVYPFFSGELLLADRLEGQQENQLIFTLGLAVQPALAAFVYARMVSRKMRILDWATLAIVFIGLLGSGSKASVMPLVLTYLGVNAYLGHSPSKGVLVGLAAALGVSFYALTVLFPAFDSEQIGDLILNRLAANTDSLEYLSEAVLEPGDFPFSGVGALFPVITKRFGFVFDYPPGVWLHGTRFGNFSGFGPNSGIVMDYFGNLSWFGLIAAPLLGFYVRACRDRVNIVRCSFLSIAYIVVVDLGIFNIPILVWSILFLAIAATSRFVLRRQGDLAQTRVPG